MTKIIQFSERVTALVNTSPEWTMLPRGPIARVDGVGTLHRSMFNDDNSLIMPDQPPAHTDIDHLHGVRPEHCDLRPWSGIFFTTGELLPPDFRSRKWEAIDRFLLGNPETRPDLERVNTFMTNVWSDNNGVHDLDSIGAWSEKFTDELYPWSGVKHHEVPEYLRVGLIPWGGDGVDNNGHYDIPLWCLEQYRRSGDIRCWDMFVKVALHQAGQGVHLGTGNWRYEKTRWIWTGDFYPDDAVRWSHGFPAGLILFAFLTGECEVVVSLLIQHLRNLRGTSSVNYNGHYGPRAMAWVLRALRAFEAVIGETSGPEIEAFALEVIDSVLRHQHTSGFIMELQGQPNRLDYTVPATVGTWAQWAFLSEAIWWATFKQDESRMNALKKLGRWLLANTMDNEGRTAYTTVINPDGSGTAQVWRGGTHTAVALPAMLALTGMGAMDAQAFVAATRVVVDSLPFGILGDPTSVPNTRSRPYGAAAPKVCASLTVGLRPWVLAAAVKLGL